jgi:hypothetical protein
VPYSAHFGRAFALVGLTGIGVRSRRPRCFFE